MNAFICRVTIVGSAVWIALSALAATSEQKERLVPAIAAEQFHQSALADPPKQVAPEQLAQWLKERSTKLIDLRSAAEYQSGHLRGAINIPLTELTEQHLEQIGIEKDSRIVVYCDFQLAPTRRIALTTLGHPTLQQLGFNQVYTLDPLWQSESCERWQSAKPCAELLPWVQPAPQSQASD